MDSEKELKDWWPSDGHDHRNIDREGIYRNTKIDRFLDNDRISLIIASKGMGKTLLMRVKKAVLISRSEGALLIPSGSQTEKVEFDEPKLKMTFPKTGFSDLVFWKGLWTTSIVLSVLCHIFAKSLSSDPDSVSILEGNIERLNCDESIKSMIISAVRNKIYYLPSYFLETFLHQHTENELRKLVKSSAFLDDLSVRFVTSQVVVLIDAFDQTLRESFPLNLEAWKSGQLGLAKAAHSLFTTNHHIKVIATIRQEAWASFVDDDKEVIEGKSIILDYNERELRKLFDTALKHYKGVETIHGFFGIDNIENTYCNELEDPFDYIYRHSTGTPRSLMHFGRALDEADLLQLEKERRVEEIRDVVDSVAARTIKGDYLRSQKSIFLKTLCDQERLKVLLDLIPSNVLTPSSLVSINREFCQRVGLDEQTSHPFCELFNVGLLGRIQQNATKVENFQAFKKSFEFDWAQEEILSKDTRYLLHPGLASAICTTRNIHLNRINAIGIDRPWIEFNGHDGIPKVFISHASVDKPEVESILSSFEHFLNLMFPSELWFDQNSILAGENIYKEVSEGLAAADILVLFASSASLSSGWVASEWQAKHEQEIKSGNIRVIVAIIDETNPADLPVLLRNKLAIVISNGNRLSATYDLAESVATHSKARIEKMVRNRCL